MAEAAARQSPSDQTFGVDVRVPDMWHAAIRQSPVFGGRLTGYDEAVMRGRKRFHRVVRLPPDAIAVVADTYQ